MNQLLSHPPVVPTSATGDWMHDRLTEARGVLADTTQHPESLVILAARVVMENYHIDNVVARIYDQGRAEVYERLGIPTVATVKWTVLQVLRRLLPEGSQPVWRDPTGDARLLQVHVHGGWVGRRISELSRAAAAPIPFVQRVGRGLVPDRDTIYQDGDILFVACMTERTDELEHLFAHPPVQN